MKLYEFRETKGIDSLIPIEREVPKPGPGQVLVRVHAVSLNYRDLLIAEGKYMRGLKLPLIPCSDGAGEVADIGPGVSRVQQGDRVAGIFMQNWLSGEVSPYVTVASLGGSVDGMLAQYVVLHENGVIRIPSHLSYEEGATLPCAAVTAWNALTGWMLKPGISVLVQGTGGVSMFALQFAKLAGARVIVTSSSDDKLRRAAELGADDGINYKTNPEWGAAVLDYTGGRGVDHVVEVGGSATLPQSIQACRTGGHIAMIGVLTGIAGNVPTGSFMRKQQRLQGLIVGNRRQQIEMVRALETTGIKPVIDQSFPLSNIADSFRVMKAGSHFGKITLEI